MPFDDDEDDVDDSLDVRYNHLYLYTLKYQKPEFEQIEVQTDVFSADFREFVQQLRLISACLSLYVVWCLRRLL